MGSRVPSSTLDVGAGRRVQNKRATGKPQNASYHFLCSRHTNSQHQMENVGLNPFPASGVQRGDGEMVKPSGPPNERNIMRFIEKKVMRGFW